MRCTVEFEIADETVIISVEKIEDDVIDAAIGLENIKSRVVFITGEFPITVYFKQDEKGM